MRRPCSFLPWQQDGTCTMHAMTAGLDLNKTGHLQVWPNRTAVLSNNQRQQLLSLRGSERAMCLKEIGWNGVQDGGLLFPHWNEANAPREIMHDLFSKGTAMTEMCGLLHVAVTQQGWFTERQLNRAIEGYPWPEGVRIPQIIIKGLYATAVGKPILRPELHF